MGSEAALAGTRKGSLYCTAKFGLRGLAQSLRSECGHAIRVSLINPGMVRTPFFDDQGFDRAQMQLTHLKPMMWLRRSLWF